LCFLGSKEPNIPEKLHQNHFLPRSLPELTAFGTFRLPIRTTFRRRSFTRSRGANTQRGWAAATFCVSGESVFGPMVVHGHTKLADYRASRPRWRPG